MIAMPLPNEPTAKLAMASAKDNAIRELPRWRAALDLDGDDDG